MLGEGPAGAVAGDVTPAAPAGPSGAPRFRRVLFRPASGRVFVKRLASAEGEGLVRQELAIAGRRINAPAMDDIELF